MRGLLSSSILSALCQLIRAILYLTCLAFITDRRVNGSGTRSARPTKHYFVGNSINYRISNSIKSLPNVQGCAILLYTMTNFVLFNPMIWYLCKIGHYVREITHQWFPRPQRKPPDPKKKQQSLRRRRLRQAVLTLSTLPLIVRGGESNPLGLVASTDLSKISHKQAQ